MHLAASLAAATPGRDAAAMSRDAAATGLDVWSPGG